MNTCTYRKTSNISRTLLGNEIVDNSDVVGASPVASIDLAKTTARGDKAHFTFGIWYDLY